jgi:hypothetical protein
MSENRLQKKQQQLSVQDAILYLTEKPHLWLMHFHVSLPAHEAFFAHIKLSEEIYCKSSAECAVQYIVGHVFIGIYNHDHSFSAIAFQ